MRAQPALGQGDDIGFSGGGGAWSLYGIEPTRYQLQETADCYYMLDPGRGIVYTFGKPAQPYQAGVRERVSVSSEGVEADGASGAAVLSADGRWVAFESSAANLVAGDSNGLKDIFRRDRVSGQTSRVSVDSAGGQADAACSAPAISGDGRHVAFHSAATNLVPGDANGKSDVFVHDLRKGTTSRVTYHQPTGKVASVTNAEGDRSTCTYTARSQAWTNPDNDEVVAFTVYDLTQVDFPDATSQQFAYDDQGNLFSRRDRAGNTWTYTYNPRGQLLTETNPLAGVTTYTYNDADGTVASRGGSDTGLIRYQYDAAKRLTQARYPDGTTVEFRYDANDFITGTTDQRGTVSSFEHDANGNLTRVDNAVGDAAIQTHRYEYDDMDRVSRYTNPEGQETRYTYTYWGGLSRITYPDDSQVTIPYDSRRWAKGMVDQAGKTTELPRDDEAVFSGFGSPTGRHLALVTDKLGNVVQVTDPLHNTYRLERDAVGRIVKVIDRLNREATFTRDGEGRVLSVTPPVIGTVTYTRNGLGLVSRLVDQRGHLGARPAGRCRPQARPPPVAERHCQAGQGRRLQVEVRHR